MTSMNELLPTHAIAPAFDYARSTATALIESTRRALPDDIAPTNPNLAAFISADELESASFTNIDCDPELMHCMIELIICDRLDCSSADISSEY